MGGTTHDFLLSNIFLIITFGKVVRSYKLVFLDEIDDTDANDFSDTDRDIDSSLATSTYSINSNFNEGQYLNLRKQD